MALAADQIGTHGERHVIAWLQGHGYKNINRDIEQLGSTDIQADSSELILILVKAAERPNLPAQPSPGEIQSIKSRAASLGRVAYVARVTVDSSGSLVGDIAWLKP